ncbi:hypothetical protein [Terricaulis sp.]|uniref:hypothetical protein n=1 Tax=Terricaulis sp. TaxID=2768686 RepID=UPI003783BCF5
MTDSQTAPTTSEILAQAYVQLAKARDGGDRSVTAAQVREAFWRYRDYCEALSQDETGVLN